MFKWFWTIFSLGAPDALPNGHKLKINRGRFIGKKKKAVICISLKPATKTISPHLSGREVVYTSYINSQK